MRRPESDFPTIKHLRDRLTDLIENGLGDLPVQILVVPNSTIEAVDGRSGLRPEQARTHDRIGGCQRLAPSRVNDIDRADARAGHTDGNALKPLRLDKL